MKTEPLPRATRPIHGSNARRTSVAKYCRINNFRGEILCTRAMDCRFANVLWRWLQQVEYLFITVLPCEIGWCPRNALTFRFPIRDVP